MDHSSWPQRAREPRRAYARAMSELGSIFNPGEAEMAKHLAAEKILPAPSPVAGDKPLKAEDGSEIYIPSLADLGGPAVMPEPPRVTRMEQQDPKKQ